MQTALYSNLFEKMVISADDREIAKIVKEYGAEALERLKVLVNT